MSDFSTFSLFTAGLALFAPLVSAYTKPTGDAPEGNPISQPGLSSIVPAGEPFTVTWEPTTQGSVTLVLLKGPSENAQPQYAIVEGIPNDGEYVWTPKTDLEPTADATGYGIQLIDDKTGQYQYTTQFGISNEDYKPKESSSSSAAAPTSSAAGGPGGYGGHGGHGAHGNGGWGHGGHNVHGGYTHSDWASGTSSSMASSYTSTNNGTATTSSGKAHGTGMVPGHNVTMVAPTGAYTSKTKTAVVAGPTGYSDSSATASTPVAPQATDNAATVAKLSFGGLVMAAGAAVLAL